MLTDRRVTVPSRLHHLIHGGRCADGRQSINVTPVTALGKVAYQPALDPCALGGSHFCESIQIVSNAFPPLLQTDIHALLEARAGFTLAGAQTILHRKSNRVVSRGLRPSLSISAPDFEN